MTDDAKPEPPLPPPDAPDAPWFVYRSGPGWVTGRPYSSSGKIAVLALLVAPLIPITAVLLLIGLGDGLVLGLTVAMSVVASLAGIFTLMFKLGRRVP